MQRITLSAHFCSVSALKAPSMLCACVVKMSPHYFYQFQTTSNSARDLPAC